MVELIDHNRLLNQEFKRLNRSVLYFIFADTAFLPSMYGRQAVSWEQVISTIVWTLCNDSLHLAVCGPKLMLQKAIGFNTPQTCGSPTYLTIEYRSMKLSGKQLLLYTCVKMQPYKSWVHSHCTKCVNHVHWGVVVTVNHTSSKKYIGFNSL